MAVAKAEREVAAAKLKLVQEAAEIQARLERIRAVGIFLISKFK